MTGLTLEELEEIKRSEVKAKMKKEAAAKAELERQEAEEAEVRRKHHEEWVCKHLQFFYFAFCLLFMDKLQYGSSMKN